MVIRGRFAESHTDFREARPARVPLKRAAEEEGRSDEGGPHGSDWREGEAGQWAPRSRRSSARAAVGLGPHIGKMHLGPKGRQSAQVRFLFFFFSIPFPPFSNPI
jgi:hypothetical protein